MVENPVPDRARYLVELSVPQAGWEDIDRLIRRARAAPSEAASDVRFVRAIYVPEDASCLLLYEASSADAAAAAAMSADFVVNRVSEIVRTGSGTPIGGTR
ncbi:MAG: nickel-binding protein [Actinomycetota bacterium]